MEFSITDIWTKEGNIIIRDIQISLEHSEKLFINIVVDILMDKIHYGIMILISMEKL